MVDKALFSGYMQKRGYTQRKLAKELGMSKNALNNKVNGRSVFTVDEVKEMCSILGISDKRDIFDIFFPG